MCRSNSTTLIAAITLIAVCGGCGRNQDIPVEIKKAETAKVGAASGGDKLDAPGNDIEGTWTVTGKPMEECVICRIDGQGHIAFNFLRLEIVGAMDDPEPEFFVYYDPKDPSKVLFPGGLVGHGNLQAAQAGTLLVEAGKLVMTLPGQEKVQLTRVRAGIDAEMRNKIRHLTPPSATDEGRTALARLTARKFSIDQRLGFGMVLKAPAGSTVTNDDIQDMIALRQVVELDLSKTAVNDAQMAAIARIDRLDRLILNYTSITDIGLEHLNNLRRLNTLNLEGTAITDAGLQKFSPSRPLHTLNLKECGGVTQSGVDDLLKRLNARSAIPFGQTSFIGVVEYRGGSQGKEDKRPVMTLRPGKAGSDSWREAVARAAKASGVDLRLDFQYVGMSDADAAHFGDFANLKVQVVAMNLDESTLTRDGISQLKKFPMLRDLSMGLAGVGDPELEAISQLSSLKRLGLNQSKITDGGLKHLVKMPALESVDLRFAKITDEGLKNLVGTRLRYVDLAGTGASEEKLRELLSSK